MQRQLNLGWIRQICYQCILQVWPVLQRVLTQLSPAAEHCCCTWNIHMKNSISAAVLVWSFTSTVWIIILFAKYNRTFSQTSEPAEYNSALLGVAGAVRSSPGRSWAGQTWIGPSMRPLRPWSGIHRNFATKFIFLVNIRQRTNSSACVTRLSALVTFAKFLKIPLAHATVRLGHFNTKNPNHTVSYCAVISYPILPYHTIPYYTIPYHTIPYHTIPCHAIPYLPHRTAPYHTKPTFSYHPHTSTMRYMSLWIHFSMKNSDSQPNGEPMVVRQKARSCHSVQVCDINCCSCV